MARQTLSRDDWVAAGFRALAHSGPKGLQINRLAKALGTTKGSFYWHFTDLAEFQRAMLELWREKVASEIIAAVEQIEDPVARLDALCEHAERPPPAHFGGRQIEPAMRAWALADPAVQAALADIDRTRIGFLESLLAPLCEDPAPLARLTYAAYLGLDDLCARGHAEVGPPLRALVALLLAGAR